MTVVAAVWTEYFAAIGVAATLVALVWVVRPSRAALLAALAWTVLAGITLVPWLVVARAQLGHAEVPFWVEPLGPWSVGGSLVQLFMGPPIDPGTPLRTPLQILQGAAVVAGAVALAGVWLGRRRLDAAGRRAALGVLGAALLGIGTLLVASLVRPIFEARYASVLWLPLYALAGAGLALLPGRSWLARDPVPRSEPARGAPPSPIAAVASPIAAVVVLGWLVPSVALGAALTHAQTPTCCLPSRPTLAHTTWSTPRPRSTCCSSRRRARGCARRSTSSPTTCRGIGERPRIRAGPCYPTCHATSSQSRPRPVRARDR